jgi:long-chain acyl-CoA synthetase
VPKGAILTHGNLTSAVSIYRAWRDATSLPEGTGRCLVLLPLFHIFALTAVLLRQLAEGHLCHLRPRFDAAAAVDDIERHRITTLSGVPTIWIGILNLPGIEGRDLSSAAPVLLGRRADALRGAGRLERLLGQRVGGGWGMTETCPAGTRITPDAPRRAGLIGLPLPRVELRVVALDDPAQPLPPGATGEIAVRGPNVFQGYWKREGGEPDGLRRGVVPDRRHRLDGRARGSSRWSTVART